MTDSIQVCITLSAQYVVVRGVVTTDHALIHGRNNEQKYDFALDLKQVSSLETSLKSSHKSVQASRKSQNSNSSRDSSSSL